MNHATADDRRKDKTARDKEKKDRWHAEMLDEMTTSDI